MDKLTPIDQAKMLVNTFSKHTWNGKNNLDSIKCALITVEELIKAFKQLSVEESGRVHIDFGHGYWEEVKEEINKL